MWYPFETSEELIFDFEALLNEVGIVIRPNSDLEKIAYLVLETHAMYKKEIPIDPSLDVRLLFADIAGLVDLVSKIVKNRSHPDFKQIIPHLEVLNNASTAVLTSKSSVIDDKNNKLLELYIALLCMRFATNIRLDNPNNSKGDNPDVMFNYRDKVWAIACKALHSKNEKTLHNTIEKGTEQINRSSAERGIVIVNFKNIIERENIWPLLNEDGYRAGEEPIFGCHTSIEVPTEILHSYGKEYYIKLLTTIGADHLISMANSGKCPPGFMVFLQAMTSVEVDDECPPTILKTFNFINFDSLGNDFKFLGIDLNEALHDNL